MSLSQPSRTIVVEPVEVPAAVPAPVQPPRAGEAPRVEAAEPRRDEPAQPAWAPVGA